MNAQSLHPHIFYMCLDSEIATSSCCSWCCYPSTSSPTCRILIHIQTRRRPSFQISGRNKHTPPTKKAAVCTLSISSTRWFWRVINLNRWNLYRAIRLMKYFLRQLHIYKLRFNSTCYAYFKSITRMKQHGLFVIIIHYSRGFFLFMYLYFVIQKLNYFCYKTLHW